MIFGLEPCAVIMEFPMQFANARLGLMTAPISGDGIPRGFRIGDNPKISEMGSVPPNCAAIQFQHIVLRMSILLAIPLINAILIVYH